LIDINFEVSEEGIKSELEERVAGRQRRFNMMGICGLDIETYVDNDRWMSGKGNFVPYMLSI